MVSENHEKDRTSRTDRSSQGAAGFRREKRNAASDVWFNLSRSLTPLNLLPLVIIALGTGVIFLTDPGHIGAAVISLITACLSGLSIYVKALADLKNQSQLKNIQDRFEQLEDRAWELHESEDRYRKVAEAFGDMIVLTNAEGRILYCNKAFETVFNGETEGSKTPEILPEILSRQLDEARKKLGRTEVSLLIDNSKRWFQWEEVPVRNERTGGVGRLSVARDITAFKRSSELDLLARKRAEEANRTKTKFLAMASHEMRTPLNGIIGMSKLLENTDLDAEQRNYSISLRNSGENLLELINSMLDLTMIEAGRFETKIEPFNFSELMNSSMELLSSRAYAKNIECGLFLDPAIPETLKTDKGRLRQIVFNLVGNAIKFTKHGGVQVRCGWVPDEGSSGTFLKIEVKDSGPGLSAKDKDRIFAEFERVDDEMTRNTDGAGLGLSISKALAKQLAGKLKLSRTSKAGSVFTLQIPVQALIETSKQSEKHDFSGHRVLIVSSDQYEAECLVDTIQSRGGLAYYGSNLKQALVWQKENRFSPTAIIIEAAKDEINLKEIRQKFSAETRVIFTTLPENKRQLESQKDQMHGWLVRPIRLESLDLVLTGKNFDPDMRADHEKEAPNTASLDTDPVARVLLAEDNDINALLATAALKRANVEVLRVQDGNEAFAQFKGSVETKRNKPFDLVLMDMHMPVLDGLGAIEKIRDFEKRMSPEKSGVPIYMLTADELPETQKNALTAGADGFLVKPIDPDALCELVLQGRRKGDAARRKAG